MFALVRVDSRLIHGQVVEVWLPLLKVRRIVVADDLAASTPLIRAAMGLAVPAPIQVEIAPLAQVDFARLGASPERVLLLLRDVEAAQRARERGLSTASLNLGNLHFAPGSVQVSPSIFLRPADLAILRTLGAAGTALDVRAVPSEHSLTLADLEARAACAAAHP